MVRLSGSRFNILVCLASVLLGAVNAQDPFSDVLTSNTQLWKSFQEEMKTLEQAAHRVNTLLTNAANQSKSQDDQEAKPAENPLDVTVLASADKLKDGVLTQPDHSSTAESDKQKDNNNQGGVKQPSNPHNLNLRSFINSIGIFGYMPEPEPWWKGKNVCLETSEKVENKLNGEKEVDKHLIVMGTGTFEHCKQTSGKYICTTVISTPQFTKTLSRTYQCCEGFRREKNQCVQVELKDIVDVLDSVGSKDFASLLKSQDVMHSLAEHNITMFAPIDQAMRSYHVEFQESNQIRGSRQARAVEEWNSILATSEQSNPSAHDVALAHIVDRLLDVDDFTNEMVMNSSYKGSPLRVNIYPGRNEAVVTVNCARVKSVDHLASHARVHTIDRLLEPVTQSVIDILQQPQFLQFRKYLEQESLLEILANASAVTVFAPSNEAWDKLGDGLRDKFSRGEACIDKVLKHHILPLTLCAAPASEGHLTTTDWDGELVRLGHDTEHQLMVDNKGRVIQEDIVATNGVIHVLDKVLIPKSAKPLSELLLSSNHTTWLGLLDRAGLLEQLNKQQNLTVFVPTEQALAEDKTRTLLDNLDTDTLRQVLLFHVTQQAAACELLNHARLHTQTGTMLHVTFTNPLFSGEDPQPAVQCAPLAYTDGKACHVVAHEVTQLLLPPNGTVLQLVADNLNLSTFRQIIKGSELEKNLNEKSEVVADSFTLLAPTNEAFDRLGDELIFKLMTDKVFADQVIRMHVVKEPVCCASITSVPWPFTNSVRTLDNKRMEINRDKNNRVLFGNATAEKCDVIATDGIIHTIDTVLLPESSKLKLGNVAFGSSNREIMLFGI